MFPRSLHRYVEAGEHRHGWGDSFISVEVLEDWLLVGITLFVSNSGSRSADSRPDTLQGCLHLFCDIFSNPPSSSDIPHKRSGRRLPPGQTRPYDIMGFLHHLQLLLKEQCYSTPPNEIRRGGTEGSLHKQRNLRNRESERKTREDSASMCLKIIVAAVPSCLRYTIQNNRGLTEAFLVKSLTYREPISFHCDPADRLGWDGVQCLF